MIDVIAGVSIPIGQLCYIVEEESQTFAFPCDMHLQGTGQHIPSFSVHHTYDKGDTIIFKVSNGTWVERDPTNKDHMSHVPEQMKTTLLWIDELLMQLNIMVEHLLLPLELTTDDPEMMTIADIRGLCESRRHRILDQLKKPYDPLDYNELKSVPGIQEFPSKAEKERKKQVEQDATG